MIDSMMETTKMRYILHLNFSLRRQNSSPEPSPDLQVSVSAEEPHGRMDPPKLGPSGEPPCVDTDNKAISPRSYLFIYFLFHYYICFT